MTQTRGSVRVTHVDHNGTWLIALEGEHDIATTSLLDKQTRGVWSHCSVAVVDLSEATFIDCSVVGWIFRARGKLNADAGGDARLRLVKGQPNSSVQRVVDLLQLDQQFPCFPTSRDALAEPASPGLRSEERHAPGSAIRLPRLRPSGDAPTLVST